MLLVKDPLYSINEVSELLKDLFSLSTADRSFKQAAVQTAAGGKADFALRSMHKL